MTMDEAELLDVLHDYVRREIAAGLETPDEIVRVAVLIWGDEMDPERLRSRAAALTDERLADHLREQQGWPAVTDCDRLDQAFAELEREGIVCRQDFTCCSRCGSRDIWDEIEQAQAEGVEVRGYAFYHSQDTDAAVDNGGLYLAYGGVASDEDGDVAVGCAIEEALQRNGLRTDWNGNPRRRIYVEVEWRRRR